MSFTPPPNPGCDWGHVYFEIDLAQVPDKLLKEVQRRCLRN